MRWWSGGLAVLTVALALVVNTSTAQAADVEQVAVTAEQTGMDGPMLARGSPPAMVAQFEADVMKQVAMDNTIDAAGMSSSGFIATKLDPAMASKLAADHERAGATNGANASYDGAQDTRIGAMEQYLATAGMTKRSASAVAGNIAS